MRKDFIDLYAKAYANSAAIASTSTETEFFRVPIGAIDELQDGKQFSLEAAFKYSNTGTPTLTFKVRAVAAGAAATTGVVICASGAITTPSGVTDAGGRVVCTFVVLANGSSGSIFGTGEAKCYAAVAPTVGSATGAPGVSFMGSAGVTVPAAVTVDCTVLKDILVTATWSAPSSSNTLTGLADFSFFRHN